MLDTTLLASIAKQMISGNIVDVDGKQVAVRRKPTSTQDSGIPGGNSKRLSKIQRSRVAGGNWHGTGIRSSSSRT